MYSIYYYISKKSGTAKSGKWYGFFYALGVNRFHEPEIRKLWIDTPEAFDKHHFSAGDPIAPIFDGDGHIVDISACDNESKIVFPPDYVERVCNKY